MSDFQTFSIEANSSNVPYGRGVITANYSISKFICISRQPACYGYFIYVNLFNSSDQFAPVYQAAIRYDQYISEVLFVKLVEEGFSSFEAAWNIVDIDADGFDLCFFKLYSNNRHRIVRYNIVIYF